MFDAYDPEFLEDPYPTYRILRQESPVFFDDTWDLTFFTRHVDISEVLKDRTRFGRDFRHRLSIESIDPDLLRRIYPPQWPTWTRYVRESFIDLEPPRHTRLRRLVAKAFTRRSSEAFRQRLENAADEILDVALDRGSMEAIDEFAKPIPVAMIADLMGIPSEDHGKLLEWSNAIVRVFDERVTEDEGVAAERATVDFVEYLEEQVSVRRRNPGDDLLSAMIEVEESGDSLTTEEIVATAILTLNAGHEATVHAIGNSLLALARNPGVYARFSHGTDVSLSVDELLRYDSPLQMFERWVLEDTEIHGHPLQKGTKVGLLFGSANRDPDVFAAPESIDLERSPNPHVSFGAGLHYCVGAPLAKVELEAALGRFARRVRSVRPVRVESRIESLVFRGVQRLELELTAA